jgi:protein O-mannosyl-transferase
MLFLRIQFSGKNQFDGFVFMRLIEQKKYSVFLILFITFAVYANTLQNEFTNWDDGPLIVNKKEIRSLDFENIKRIFDYKASGTYQPVRVFSYAIDYHFWGLNPVGYHIHNIFLHGLAAVLIYLSLLNMIPQLRGGIDNKERTQVQYIAFFTALFFIVHPVNVEAVTWLSSRKYVLLSFFSFLSLHLYVLNTLRSKYSWILGMSNIIAALLAVFSSPFGVVLPILFFLYDFCRDKSNNVILILRKNIVYYLPFFIFFILALPKLWTVLVIGSSREHYLGNPISTLKSMLFALFDYGRNFIFPLWLNARYPDFVKLSIVNYKIIISTLIIAAVSVLLFRQVKSYKKWYLFCFGWAFIAWLPVSNIIPLSTKMADRYIYLASFGVFLWFVSEIFRIFSPNYKKVANIVIVLLLIFCSGLTVNRNTKWKNSITLWTDSLKKEHRNVLALTNLGSAYYTEEKYEAALKYYKIAAQRYPDHFAVHNNLATTYRKLNQLKKAAQEYLLDIEINPEKAGSYIMLASVYDEMGLVSEAEEVYITASRMDTDNPELHYKMGTFYAKQGKFENALNHLENALSLKKDYPKAWYDKGRVFHEQGFLDKAKNCYLKAIFYNERYPEPYNSLGNIMLSKRDYMKAEEYYYKALKIRENYPEVLFNLGNGYALRNDYKKALELYEKALAVEPDYKAAENMIRQIKNLMDSR